MVMSFQNYDNVQSAKDGFFDLKLKVREKLLLIMKGIRASTAIITELVQYFLQKTFFMMLINYALNK